MMTSRQIDLVKQSFRLVEPIIDEAATVFYRRLFETEPSLQRLFHKLPREQARLLAQTLTIVVDSIDNASHFRVVADALGSRCANYGMRDEHFEAVGQALLWTLENGLKGAFTSEVRDAWVAACGWLAFTVQRAMSRCRADPQVGRHAHPAMPPDPCSES